VAKLKITNFSQMNPEAPEYGPKNQNYLLSGVDPFYYLAQTAVQEQRVAPLAASRTFVSFNTFPGNIVFLLPSSITTFDALVLTDDGTVSGSDLTNFGQPNGASPNVGMRAAIFSANVLWITPTSANLFRKPITTPAASWTITTPLNLFGVGAGVRFLKPFLDFCAVSDNDGTAKNSNHIVRKIDSGFLASLGIDLGVGWNIVAMENYNNRYLAVVGSYSGDGTFSGGMADINYLFLWNGISARYNSAVRIPGIFWDMKVIGDTLYFVIVERLNQFALYKLVNNSLVKVFNIAIDTVKSGANANTVGYGLFNYNDALGINLNSKGQFIYDTFNKSKYILTPQDFTLEQRAGPNGIIYAAKNTVLYTYQASGYSPITYVSQWIPFQDPKTIVVKYATPPGAGDSIQVTLLGYDEDGTASSSLPLQVIDNTHFYNSYKTPLDCKGFRGKQVQVKLQTVSASGWAPIIREVELIN